jgi:nucleotide-binding universal stress UspA family protein
MAAAEMGQQLKTVSNILIPLDGSAASRAAIPIARRLAQLYKAAPHLLYLGLAPLDPKSMLLVLGVTPEDMPGAVLDSYQGDAGEAIARAARDLPQALIVMCTHTGEQVHPDRFGSVTEAVLAGKPERIVLVAPERGDIPWTLQRVLLAHDGTSACDPATALAAEISMLAQAEVIALHVAVPKAASPEEPGSIPAPRYIDQPQHEWPAWTGEFKDRMLAMGAPLSAVHFDLVVSGGQRGSEIAEVARSRQADMAVMAWDREWECAKHMATRVVIRSSGCPVLLVGAKSA